MFDIFGEFDTFEELNMAAEGLKNEGDTDSLYKLAEENGIEMQSVTKKGGNSKMVIGRM